MTNTALQEIATWEGTEGAAWQSAWDAAPLQLREGLGMSYERHGGLTMFRANKLPSWFFNRMTIGVGAEQATRELLHAELERFLAAGTPYGVSVPPGARPEEIPEWLSAHGLVQTTTLARMIRSTEKLPHIEIETQIRQVGREDASLFGETAVRGFGLPGICREWLASLSAREGWRTYLAYEAGEPVATGALYVHGKIGWLGFGSTGAEQRKRGIHRAMLTRRMADAADLGCRWLQTETNLAVGDEPTPSLNNMKRLGFQMAYARPNYVFTPA